MAVNGRHKALSEINNTSRVLLSSGVYKGTPNCEACGDKINGKLFLLQISNSASQSHIKFSSQPEFSHIFKYIKCYYIIQNVLKFFFLFMFQILLTPSILHLRCP